MTPTLTISIGRMAAAIGGTKESGKRSTHAAHDHDMFIFIVKTEEFSDCVSDTATHLQGGTFTVPADPPNRCVISVEIKIKGAMRRGSSSSEWMAEMTRLVPVSFFVPQQMVSTDNDQSPDREQI